MTDLAHVIADMLLLWVVFMYDRRLTEIERRLGMRE